MECSKDSVLYMQNNLRIIDPLYGALRPLDRMQPYRLEMATRNLFSEKQAKQKPSKLHEFWKDTVTQLLASELAERPADRQILLNLASDEYASAVDSAALQERIPDVQYVKVIFRESSRVIAVHAKRARGLMVKYLSETQAQTLDDVRAFAAEGYKLVAKESDDMTLVFDRAKQPPAKKASVKKATPAAKGNVKKRASSADEKVAEPKKRGRKAKSK